MLTNTCKTAIKAVVYLASKQKGAEKIAVKEISEHIDGSIHTIGKVLQILVRQGVINSVKGPSGGFFLNEKQLHQPIIRVIEAVDGLQIFEKCGLGLANCSGDHPCPIHKQYGKPRDMIKKIFTDTKILDLINPLNKGMTYLIK
ncbi:MAG: Rrf2 family transcriptional regulator [Bacteroidetes bacterium]|nr:Rrf2 family transcriptional regulator [Bacteroidota bacterium]